MNNKNIIYLALLLCPNAYALPLPQFTATLVGLGELLLIGTALISLYLPFLYKFKGNKNIYLLLFLSMIMNGYFISQQVSLSSPITDKEDIPGMIWDQQERDKAPNAIGEKEAYQILLQQQANKKSDYIFIDARTRSETELGTAGGFSKIRWPDLIAHHEYLKDKTVIATCWTGMRGSKVCAELKKHGINCKFLRGGLKAWVEAKLPVSLAPSVMLPDFGTAQSFPNSHKMLSVKEAIQYKDANIIDIRDEALFKKEHLKNSINIPFDSLSKERLDYAILTLPNKPIMVVCYGSVSCSEAASFGWEVNRLGMKYVGVYAGGIQYFYDNLPALQKDDYYTIIIKKLAFYLNNISTIVPIPFLLCIISIVLGVLLYITKNMSVAYFDNLRHEKNSHTILKKKFTDNVLVQREKLFNVKNNLKYIGYNFVSLALALLATITVEIVYGAFANKIFWGYANWHMPAGFSVLTILSSLLITFGIYISFFKQHNKAHIIFSGAIICFIALLWLIKNVSGISLLLLNMTMTIVLVPSIYKHIKEMLIKHTVLRDYKNGYIDLKHAYLCIAPNTKAHRLSYLKHQGFNVPDGVVVQASHISKIDYSKITKKLGSYIGVRSSALNEDMQHSSHAGLNLSIMPINISKISLGVKKVYESYASHKKDEIILIQKCIKPLFSGAVFSHHPSWGGTILLEWGQGLSSNRMEGTENSYQVVVDRVSGSILWQNKKDDRLNVFIPQIFNLIKKVESIYECAIDIEWAIDQQGLWLLQARPQSALENLYPDILEHERNTLLMPTFNTLTTNELSIHLQNCSRLTASLICNLWQVGNSADQASRMALWKWNNSYIEQDAYVYKFGRIWASSKAVITQPNSLTYYSAKKDLSAHIYQISQQAKILLDNNILNIAVNWNLLTNEQWLKAWQNGLKNWHKMQTFAFYFELMAQAAINHHTHKHNQSIQTLLAGNNFIPDNILYLADIDYEISCARYAELSNINIAQLKSTLLGKNTISDISHLPLKMQQAINHCRQLISLREEYKYYCLQLFYFLRLAILDLQKRLNLGQEIFELDINEIEDVFSNPDIVATLQSRLQYKEQLASITLPDTLDIKAAALLGRSEHHANEKISQLCKKGIFVSTPKTISGHIVHIQHNSSIAQLHALLSEKGKGGIIYCKAMTPAIVNLSAQYGAAGVCSLYGSMLSHPAVLARENSLPFIVNIDLQHIENNITINMDGEIVL